MGCGEYCGGTGPVRRGWNGFDEVHRASMVLKRFESRMADGIYFVAATVHGWEGFENEAFAEGWWR